MATKPARSRSKRSPQRKGSAGGRSASAKGKHLVIVESPAKAKTINRYLGAGYMVQASVGHVRDLPRKAPKGSKQPVPGVDLENQFEPTYVVLPTKRKTLNALKQAAREAADVWFATDLDREGEAIAWHLAQELGIDPTVAKRVIFNAITKSQIEHAFANPHAIDMFKVNAQQAGVAAAVEEGGPGPQRRPGPVGGPEAHRGARAGHSPLRPQRVLAGDGAHVPGPRRRAEARRGLVRLRPR
jgi:DNA topoisomerase-1